jgi:hypothetical protein
MSADLRLAQAIGSVVHKRLAAGLGYLRIPEIVSPLPVAELLDDLADLGDTRSAGFLDAYTVSDSTHVTTQVHEAIRWRNDPDVSDNLIVVGDLERDRAAGLAGVTAVTASEVRQQLLDQLVAEARSRSASAKTVRLLQALKSERIAVDLQHLADYSDDLAASFGTNDLDEAGATLWRLKLLPDTAPVDVDVRRLRDNAQRVNELRQSDATTIQRLIRQLASQEPGNYEALRLFASTGKREYLRHLRLDAVREALRSARAEIEDGRGEIDDKARSERTQFLEAVRAGSINEAEFLGQFADDGDDDSPQPIAANGTDLDWDRVATTQLTPLLEDDGGTVPYAESAGSLEVMPPDEPDPLPGKGDVKWDSLRELVDDLRNLEDGIKLAGAPSEALERIIALRQNLERFSPDLPREGVRLFLAAPNVAEAATQLVDTWVVFWQAMDQLRSETTEVGELLQIGKRLALTDTRVVEQGTAITAYLLPLHPMVLEPRVRAAAMFREHPELDQDFFQLIVGSLDPAVPSIKVPVQDTNYDLAYSGQFRSLPQYERRAQQFHSPDVVRALQDIIDRFINVHPYARRSIRVALVDPTAETAKQLLKWLANVDISRRERVAMDVYVQRESYDEVYRRLAEAQAELVSAEIAGSRFTYSVERLARIEDLHAHIAQSDRSPHVLCLFDPAEVTQNATPIASLTPVLGALVNEWEFGTRARKDATPYIRPRTGSSSLNEFLSAQARLLGTDSLGTTERTPLLPEPVLSTLESVGADTSWVVVAQGASALVAPPSIGRLKLLGRTTSGDHTGFVYSEEPALILEPVLAYLQQHAYLQADVDDLIRFVLNTIRLALPEGLLGFYKRQGVLSDESVLGRLGLAAVVAHLQAASEDPHDLIVSLDTEGARRWLGLREGVARRADLIRFDFADDLCSIEAIEIKARSGSLAWGSSPPEAVMEAVEQVHTMRDLLVRVFVNGNDDQLTASRREILKRQVFLEALHQWEPLRSDKPTVYRAQVRALNRLFSRETEKMDVDIRERIFLATPGDEGGETDGVSMRSYEGIDVVQLGLGWFRTLLARRPGGSIQLDPNLVDMLDLDATLEGSGQGDAQDERVGSIGTEASLPTSSTVSTEPDVYEDGPDVVAAPELQTPFSPHAAQEDLRDLLSRLQASFRARGIPYVSINSDEAVVGPSVVQFPVRLEVGARSSQVESQADDIARDLGVQAFRITNYPGRPGYALAEVPRATREIPDVTTLVRPDLPYPAVAVGAGLDFTPYWDCLDHIPHLLIAGKTGSGKSVLIRSLLWQLTRLYRPDELDLVLIGPKAADYLDFTAAPHFKAADDIHLRVDGAIDLLREIVEVRYPRQQASFDDYARAAVRSGTRLSNLRELLAHARATDQMVSLRPFVVIIDEFVDLLEAGPSNRKEFEALIARFSRLFRYIGGTMIAATQRPSVKSITGDIKANFRPLALRVERSVDSRVILDENGAEQLIGHGDSLYKADEGLVRLQGYAALGTYID